MPGSTTHGFGPVPTIAGVYEMRMKFPSGFCKNYFKKVSNGAAGIKALRFSLNTDLDFPYSSGADSKD
jgi:hypothetical protein